MTIPADLDYVEMNNAPEAPVDEGQEDVNSEEAEERVEVEEPEETTRSRRIPLVRRPDPQNDPVTTGLPMKRKPIKLKKTKVFRTGTKDPIVRN